MICATLQICTSQVSFMVSTESLLLTENVNRCTSIRHALSAAEKLKVDMLSIDGFECAGKFHFQVSRFSHSYLGD